MTADALLTADLLRALTMRPCEKHWRDLSEQERHMAVKLGFDEMSWIKDVWCNIRTDWERLAGEQMEAAKELGFEQPTWFGGRKGQVCCEWPACGGRPFGKLVDLKAHCIAKHGGRRFEAAVLSFKKWDRQDLKPLSPTNRGHQLLRKMGWTGGGLGADGGGLVAP
eukprot:919597-Prymnesium_polylepis.1